MGGARLTITARRNTVEGVAPASSPELSSIDGSWDTPARPPRRPSSRMSVIDHSWSEPHGVAVVAPEMLATGTAAHATAAFADTEPLRFLGMPVASPRTASRVDAAGGRAGHDATSLVDPLPAPPRPGALDRSAPRAAVIPDEHAARSRQRRSDRHRRRVAILAGAVAGVALACGLTVLSSREPDRQAAAPQQQQQEQQPQQQPRAIVPITAPPAAPAKHRHASTAAPKKPASAPKRTAAQEPAKPDAQAAKPSAPAKSASAKSAPAKSAAAKSAPTKSASAKSASAKPGPAKSASAKSVPAKPAPAKTASAKTAPAKTAPVKTASAKPAGERRSRVE